MVSSAISRFVPALRGALMLLMALAMMGLPLYGQSETAVGEQELSVDEVLARHYDAVGGDRHRDVESMKTVGRSIVMGMEAPYTRYTKRPNKLLLEIYVQGMTGVQAFDGESAWWFMPFMGHAEPESMPGDMAAGVVESAEFDGPLIDPAKKGHSVELVGIEAVKGDDAYKLRVTMATGGTQTHYVDTKSFYVTRVESAEGDAVFLDHQLFHGFPVPQTIEMMGPMGEQIIYVDEVEFDVALDDAMFSMR